MVIGVGLSLSEAIISPVGVSENIQGKAFGECVFRATKISKATQDAVYIDERLYREWPVSKGGKLKFEKRDFNDFIGYKPVKIDR